MADFPSLSSVPSVRTWREEVATDPTIRSEYEAGYVLTRARFTRIPRKWSVMYNVVRDADKQLLEDFEREVKVGSEAFNWTNPLDNNVYVVRFVGPLRYTLLAKGLWRIEFVLEEV